MSDPSTPSRRAVLRWLGAAAPAVGGAEMLPVSEAVTADSSQQTVPLEVAFEDIDGDPVDGGEVAVYRTQGATDPTTDLIATASTDTDTAEVTVPETAADQFDFLFFICRVVVEAADSPDQPWFGTEVVDLTDGSPERITVGITERLLTGYQPEYGTVSVFQRVSPEPGQHTLYVETRGRDAWSTEAGLFTLQHHEAVDVGYRPTDEVDFVDRAENHRLPPEGYYTDQDDNDEPDPVAGMGDPHRNTAERLRAAEPLPVPTFLLYYPEYDSYRLGERERGEAQRRQLFWDFVNLALFALGTATTGGVTTSVALIFAGATVNELADRTVPSPETTPAWAQGENRDVWDNGRLPIDFEVFDFVTGSWRWDTDAFVQAFPLDFSDWVDVFGDQASPEVPCLCLRGSTKLSASGTDESPQQLDIRQVLSFDPTVRSPNDIAASTDSKFMRRADCQRLVGAAADEASFLEEFVAEVTLDATIQVSNSAPTTGEPITLDASASSVASPVEIAEYRWTIEQPERSPFRQADATSQGPRRPRGETVTATFDRPGDHRVQLVVEDETGNVASDEVYLEVREPPPPEIPPVATEAGDTCVFPPTGEELPATGPDAATHFGYGCGDWKVYRVVPGRTYTIASTIDTCPDCLLYDGSYVIDESVGADPDSEEFSGVEWAQRTSVEGLTSKAAGDRIHQTEFTPDAPFIRIRNVDGGAGLGFYASVYGPRRSPASSESAAATTEPTPSEDDQLRPS